MVKKGERFVGTVRITWKPEKITDNEWEKIEMKAVSTIWICLTNK